MADSADVTPAGAQVTLPWIPGQSKEKATPTAVPVVLELDWHQNKHHKKKIPELRMVASDDSQFPADCDSLNWHRQNSAALIMAALQTKVKNGRFVIPHEASQGGNVWTTSGPANPRSQTRPDQSARHVRNQAPVDFIRKGSERDGTTLDKEVRAVEDQFLPRQFMQACGGLSFDASATIGVDQYGDLVITISYHCNPHKDPTARRR